MDVGAPSNFARILDLYENNDVHQEICHHISGARFTDEEIADTIRRTYQETGYLLDPHGACGYQALSDYLSGDEQGIFLETAHPAKFKDTIDRILHTDIPIPEKLQAFMQGKKQSIGLPKTFDDFKQFLLDR